MEKIIGKCSLCGGDVVIPYVWHGTIPPKPTCSFCGATQKMPVIEMEKSNNEKLVK